MYLAELLVIVHIYNYFILTFLKFLLSAEVFSECIELTRFGAQQKEVALLDDTVIEDADIKARDKARYI